MFRIGSVHSTIADAVKWAGRVNFLEKNHTSKDEVQGINIKAVSEIIAQGTPKDMYNV